MQTDLFSQQENHTPVYKGSNYDESLDKKRLDTQYDKIFKFMADGLPRTLNEIELGISNQHPRSARNKHKQEEKDNDRLLHA
jgi:hypothetical protein